MGVVGAGLFSLGAAELARPGLFGGRLASTTRTGSVASTPTTSVAGASSTSSLTLPSQSTDTFSSLPDYQAFLSWLNSVSGPYRGKSLNVSMEDEFGPFSTQFIDQDFTSASGITDDYNILPYEQQLDDISLMASTKSDTYDVYTLDVENLGVFPNLPISPYDLMDKYPDLTYPEFDLNDFYRYSWDRISTYPPDLSGGNGGTSATDVTVLPFDTPTLILFYRKDVFNQLKLTLPATWDDHLANCQAIQKSGLTPFGTVNMAAADISIIYEYQAHLASFGGSLWAIDGNTITPTINTDAGVAALEDLIRFAPYSDVGSATYTFGTTWDSIAHGYSATGLLFDGFASWLNNPQRAPQVNGLMGYAQCPAGPKGSFHPYAGSGIGVSRYSKNPQMAWLYVQWATCKGSMEAKLLGAYHNFPTRSSVTQVPDIATDLQNNSLVQASLVNQIWNNNSLTTLIGFPLWLQAATILEADLNAAWIGTKTPQAALTDAQTNIEKIGTLTF
jgi:multiple sugar transport system substrate-binding protein